MNGPPNEVEGRAPHHRDRPSTNSHTSSQQTTDTVETSAVGRRAAHDALAAIRRRPYRHSTGLRASGYREAWPVVLKWVQREFDEHLDPIGKARLAAVIARSEDA